MLHIGLNNHSYIIDDREIDREGISYSIDTIRSIIEDYVDGKIYLIIGSDALQSLHKWKDFPKIISLCNIIVIARMSDDNNPIINNQIKSHISKDLAIFHSNSYGKIFLEETSVIDISSTEIRNRLQNNQKISNLTPPLLEKWLLSHKIY